MKVAVRKVARKSNNQGLISSMGGLCGLEWLKTFLLDSKMDNSSDIGKICLILPGFQFGRKSRGKAWSMFNDSTSIFSEITLLGVWI